MSAADKCAHPLHWPPPHRLSDVTSSVTTEAPSVVAHNAGEEASKIATEASHGVQNVGKAGLDATLGTSTVYHG